MTDLRLDSHALERLNELAGELGEMRLGETEAAFEHALRQLAALVGADDAFWVLSRSRQRTSASRLLSWEAVTVQHLDPAAWRTALDEARERLAAGQPDRLTTAYAEGMGRDRSARPVDLMARRLWEEDWYVREHLAPRGVRDQLQASSAIDASVEVTVAFRRTARSRFNARERDLLLVAASVLRRPLRELVLAGGWLGSRRGLSRRERQVLDLLLGGLKEAEIAQRLGIAPRTAHHHVTAVYRRLGVQGRAGLLALWAGRGDFTARRARVP